jgi:hypothetical protein
MNPKLVFDTNCIIDLEENRSDAQQLSLLVKAWKNGNIDLAVVAVSASENQPTNVSSPNYGVFESKLKNVGLTGAHELMPMGIWDVFYWDHFLWSSDEMEALASQIRAILFQGVAAVAPENIEENSKWRNQMCDVLVAWSCIYHNWPILVTRDANFHKHRAELVALGIKEVLYPVDAARLYSP